MDRQMHTRKMMDTSKEGNRHAAAQVFAANRVAGKTQWQGLHFLAAMS
jgi:hypothetical protein